MHLTSCFACVFPRAGSQPTIDFINTNYPLPRHLRHLKRIRPLAQKGDDAEGNDDDRAELQMLVAPTEELTESEWLEIYSHPSSDTNALAFELKARMQVVEVPTHMPKTRSSWEQQRTIWPMSFHHHMHDKRQHAEQVLLEELLSKTHRLIHDNDDEELLCLVRETGEVACQVEAAAAACTSLRVLEHPAMLLVKRKAAIDSVTTALPRKDYLCTGLVGILPFEPCLMCAMALTHSRIRAIIVTSIASKDGPWSQYGLHQLRGLNHHYRVYYTPLCES